MTDPRDKKIEEQLSSAVSRLIPEDMLDRIEQGIVQDQERTPLMTNQTNHKSKILPRLSGILVAACLLLAVGLVGGRYYQNNLAVASTVDIDVNPSIEISANRNDRVVKVEAVNGDAEAILDGMDLKGTDLNVAVNAVIGALVKQGYLTDDAREILVTVRHEDAAKAQILRSVVVSDIDAALKASGSEAAILNQTVTSDDSASAFAKEQGVSLGKAVFVLNLAALDDTLDPKALAAMSLKELTALIRERGLDVRHILDYDADDSLFENIADNIEDGNEAAKAAVTPAEAKEKALAAAGVKAEDAAFIRCELDEEDCRLYYEIEFRAKGIEYEYEVNAKTGAVEKEDTDTDRRPAADSGKKITADEAKAAALAHAGVKASDARVLKVSLDYEDGVAVYEVDFIVGRIEYEYEIHAASGRVLSHEKDVEDDLPVHTPPADTDSAAPNPNEPQPERLTAAEAENAALKHAGVKRADARFERTELDEEEGRTVYEVSFRVGNTEYEYEIDAYSGKVLSHEKDIDD